MSLPLGAWIGLGVGLALVATIGFVLFIVARAARAAERRFVALLRGESSLRRSNAANFSGRVSQGAKLRGNGILALTPTRLLFVMWAPRIDLELPLSHVRGARAESAFLGRVAPTLVVEFEDRAGAKDEAGWVTREVGAWVEAVRARAGKGAGVSPP
jgi:hypothetical protein